MARIRYLKPDFFLDEDLAKLDYWIRILFQGLWCHADKAGRLKDRPIKLKALIFPYDNVDIKEGLNQLTQKKKYGNYPFIHRYEHDKQNYIQIIGWQEHQKPHHQEPESKLPEMPIKLYNELKKTLTLTDNLNYKYKEASCVPPNQHRTNTEPHQRISEQKDKYLDFIMLYKAEHDKLIANLGENQTNQLIEALNNYIGSKGKKYKSHYYTILTWSRKSQDGISQWLNK